MIALIVFTTYVAAAFIGLFLLWLLFVVAMAMKQAQKENRLAEEMVQFGEKFIVGGTIYDVFCNVFFASAVFFEEPREATVSARLRRLVVASRWGWQKRLARWVAVVAMNPFCPPNEPHIRLPE